MSGGNGKGRPGGAASAFQISILRRALSAVFGVEHFDHHRGDAAGGEAEALGDAQGHVDLDSLSERARCNYWFARTVIGREVDVPRVRQMLN